MKAFQLKFENTCTENWNTMQHDEKGKFCKLCSKSVVDFTGSSREEILSYLKANKNTCGKMSSSQLKQPVFEQKRDSFPISYSKTTTRIMMAASIGAVALGNAQETTKVNSPTFKSYVTDRNGDLDRKQTEIKNDSIALKQKNQEAPMSFFEINGNVKSKATAKNLAKVKVTFYGLSNYITAFTDEEGNYTLKVPETLILDNNLISYTFMGITESTDDDGFALSQGFEAIDSIVSKEQLSKKQTLLADHVVYYLGGAYFSTYEPKPLVFVDGEKVAHRKLDRFHRGKKTQINFASMNTKFIEGNIATQLYGKKAKDGVYLFYNKLSE